MSGNTTTTDIYKFLGVINTNPPEPNLQKKALKEPATPPNSPEPSQKTEFAETNALHAPNASDSDELKKPFSLG
jgi:hypothetical protein